MIYPTYRGVNHILEIRDLKTCMGVRANKRNMRSQGHAGATASNDTLQYLKRGNFVQG